MGSPFSDDGLDEPRRVPDRVRADPLVGDQGDVARSRSPPGGPSTAIDSCGGRRERSRRTVRARSRRAPAASPAAVGIDAARERVVRPAGQRDDHGVGPAGGDRAVGPVPAVASRRTPPPRRRARRRPRACRRRPAPPAGPTGRASSGAVAPGGGEHRERPLDDARRLVEVAHAHGRRRGERRRGSGPRRSPARGRRSCARARSGGARPGPRRSGRSGRPSRSCPARSPHGHWSPHGSLHATVRHPGGWPHQGFRRPALRAFRWPAEPSVVRRRPGARGTGWRRGPLESTLVATPGGGTVIDAASSPTRPARRSRDWRVFMTRRASCRSTSTSTPGPGMSRPRETSPCGPASPRCASGSRRAASGRGRRCWTGD